MKFSSLISAIEFLEKYIPTKDRIHSGKLGLERMKILANLLGNSQDKYPTIHVGGTSGKGSTSTFIASILATKYKVGLYTSPHLERVNERIVTVNSKQETVNKREISDNEFTQLVNDIYPLIKKMEREKLGAPSYFEIITAMAFLYFEKVKVDFAVIEVGLGGTYDATNVIKPLVSVITNVGLDHTEVLGDTVEKIARDKVGIIKQDSIVVSGVKQPSVVEIIKRKALSVKGKDNNLSLLGRDFGYKILLTDSTGSVFDYIGEKKLNRLRINMLGEHQVENAVIAVKAVEAINSKQKTISRKPLIDDKSIQTGLKQAFIPGRFEVVRKNQIVVLDGAHNPDKIKALVSSMKKLFPKKKYKVILAIKEGKNSTDMLKIILPVCQVIYLTEYKILADQGEISSYSSIVLKKEIERIKHKMTVKLISLNKMNIDSVVENTTKDDIILMTGSLYLLGQIRKFFKK